MARLTKEERQEIIRDFAQAHGGLFNPASFVEEIRKVGRKHPAYGWFTWDRNKAAFEYQLWQAREFAVGLRIRFTVEEIGRSKRITIRERIMPFAISPVERRREDGGYYVADPENPEHMAEYCRQAATALRTWINRYGAAVSHAGGSPRVVERLLKMIEEASVLDESRDVEKAA